MQRRVSDAQLALADLAAQEGDRDRDFLRRDRFQAFGDLAHLCEAAARLANPARDRRDLGEQRHLCRPDVTSGLRCMRAGAGKMGITVYGIRNCDTMKKARAWLEDNHIEYGFHDYKVMGIDRERLEGWCRKASWETLLNRAGTTFRKLPEADKAGIDRKKAVALMLAQPSMIKRPVLESGKHLLVGFSPESYKCALR